MTVQVEQEPIPSQIGMEEKLGRGVFSSKDAGRASRNQIPASAFVPPKRRLDISVDRLDFVTTEVATSMGDHAAAKRSTPELERSYYGRVVIKARYAQEDGRIANATPHCCNPYHADIVLPDSAMDEEIQNKHAQQLASASCWEPRPELDSQ